MTSHNSAADMLRDAGTTMYRAKALGKGRCEIFDGAMHTQAVKRLKVETDLRKALDRHELEVYYQPIVRLQTEEIMGFEALVRWNHPQDGLLLPDSFIPVAEQTGLIQRHRQLGTERKLPCDVRLACATAFFRNSVNAYG